MILLAVSVSFCLCSHGKGNPVSFFTLRICEKSRRKKSLSISKKKALTSALSCHIPYSAQME